MYIIYEMWVCVVQCLCFMCIVNSEIAWIVLCVCFKSRTHPSARSQMHYLCNVCHSHSMRMVFGCALRHDPSDLIVKCFPMRIRYTYYLYVYCIKILLFRKRVFHLWWSNSSSSQGSCLTRECVLVWDYS